MRELIFLDCETTGLDERNCELVELSYALERGPIKTLYFGVESVPPVVDKLIGFTERGIAGLKSEEEEVQEFLDLSSNQTLIAANPFFDRSVLITHNLWNMHYRTIDIETYAMKALGLNEVPSMKNIFDSLTLLGFRIPEPRHTSESDVQAMRRCYEILRYK